MKYITSCKDVVGLVSEPLKDQEQEFLLCITLLGKGVLKSVHWLTSGTDTQTSISAKQIAKVAILDNASGVILVHNHPSGDPKPSYEDIKQTESVKKALDLFEIRLLDHVIMGADSAFSFADEKEVEI